MEGFKKPAKMQCFKEGGSVKYESRKEHKEEMDADIKQDKAIVKKAFAMHDKQEHKGEKTDLSKLKKGGRAKKAQGTVKKYKTGGTVEVAYGAKKTDKDIKDIANSKRQKPALLCGGGKAMKKYAEGGGVLGAIKEQAVDLKNKIIGTPEQNAEAQKYMDRQAAQGSKLAKFFGGKADAESAPVKKCSGGKIKKYAAGGKIAKIAAGVAPAAFMGAAVAPAAYKDLTSGYSAKQRAARQAEEEAAKAKPAETESAPVAKKRGGKC